MTNLTMWPDLTWRLDDINDRHAKVTVFDHGARAGALTLDRATWDLLTGYRQGMDVPATAAVAPAVTYTSQEG